jgi:prepilin-type processing-associated H-X9-DG protein
VRSQAQAAICASNMRQLSVGIIQYVSDNEGWYPWAGGVDRNVNEDWVWGGQPRADTENRIYWNQPPASFGHHAEAGSVFPYVVQLPLIRNGTGKNGIDESHRAIYPIYRCPSTGPLGEALRVNYSLNNYIDSSRFDGTLAPSERGVALSHVRGPSGKVLLVNEDPRTMHNASFAPGGSADGTDGSGTSFEGDLLQVIHNGGINVSFMDGHVERCSHERILAMQKDAERYFIPAR